MKTIAIPFILLLGILESCNLYMDKEEEMIYIVNNADFPIHIVATTQYSDTVFPSVLSENTHRCTAYPQGKGDPLIVYEFLNSSDTITFFILKEDEVLNHSWKDISENHSFLSIYVLSKSDISLLSETKYHKTIPYPPTSAMKNMKLYPSYEEITKQQ